MSAFAKKTSKHKELIRTLIPSVRYWGYISGHTSAPGGGINLLTELIIVKLCQKSHANRGLCKKKLHTGLILHVSKLLCSHGADVHKGFNKITLMPNHIFKKVPLMSARVCAPPLRMLFSILTRRGADVCFENTGEVTGGGKAEIRCDCGQRFIRIAEKALCLLRFFF